MKETKIIRTIYIADDGKEFFSKSECEDYEKNVLQVMKNIRYFTVMSNPDLTETGSFQSNSYFAVYSGYGYHKEILEQYLIKKYGSIIGPSVMGYGLQKQFHITECSRGNFEYYGGKFLSYYLKLNDKNYKDIFDYSKAWDLKLN